MFVCSSESYWQLISIGLVMTCCHYLKHWWLRPMTSYGIPRSQWVNLSHVYKVFVPTNRVGGGHSGLTLLNFCCFLACDLSKSSHTFADKLLIRLSSNLVDELIMALPRPGKPFVMLSLIPGSTLLNPSSWFTPTLITLSVCPSICLSIKILGRYLWVFIQISWHFHKLFTVWKETRGNRFGLIGLILAFWWLILCAVGLWWLRGDVAIRSLDLLVILVLVDSGGHHPAMDSVR